MGIWLYDTRAYEVEPPLKVHLNRVTSLVFGPDGLLLAGFGPDVWTRESGGRAGTVLLWDAATGTLRHILEGHVDEVWSVAFSPDVWTLASGSLDGTILLWDAVSDAAAGTSSTWRPIPTGTGRYGGAGRR